MKIILKNLDKEELILSDENFDGAGWVEIIAVEERDEAGEIVRSISVDIHISDIYPAILAFKTAYDEQIKRDSLTNVSQ